MSSPSLARSHEILAKLRGLPEADNPKLQNYLDALDTALQGALEEQEAAAETLRQFEEAYEKLTAPANRIGVFIKHLDGNRAVVALGETEYVTLIDPKLADSHLGAGQRVMLNEAFAVIGVIEAADGGAIVKVSEVDVNGRLRVGASTPGSDGRLVQRSEALVDAAIQVGDEIRVDGSGRFAIEHLAKPENREYFVEDVPELPWSKIGGQEDAIRLIKETIESPLLHPEIYDKFEKKPIKGILLYGPPGCGKTLIGKATAYNLARAYSEQVGHEVKEYFMSISGPKILNMWLGETERMVREIFQIAREKAKQGRLVFIFMDEAESLLRTRSSGRYLNISNTVVPQFCAELDGLVALENVVLMLTSNRPDFIDPAVLRPERIDRKVKVSRPDRDAARQILGLYLTDRLPLDPLLMSQFNCDAQRAREHLLDEAIDVLWRTTKTNEFLKLFYRNGNSEVLFRKDLVSGALLKSIVDRAKDAAIRRSIADQTADQGIALDDLLKAIDEEYKENEIFPRSDAQEDWLKLLDVEPEHVASVKPVHTAQDTRKNRNPMV